MNKQIIIWKTNKNAKLKTQEMHTHTDTHTENRLYSKTIYTQKICKEENYQGKHCETEKFPELTLC